MNPDMESNKWLWQPKKNGPISYSIFLTSNNGEHNENKA